MSVTQSSLCNVLCHGPGMGLRAGKVLALARAAAGLMGARNGAKVINNHVRGELDAWNYGASSAFGAGVGAGGAGE